jgi:TPR repeat protein
LAASHSYDAKPSRINSTHPSPFFSNNANDPVKTGSPRALSSGSQVPSNAGKTLQQLWTAVQAGDSNAAIALADRYMRGDGVPANCVQARVLLLAASERNNAIAIKKLHELDKNGCS